MRPQVLLVALAVFAVLVALPLGKAAAHGEEEEEEEEGVVDAIRRRWPCCDDCGFCTKSNPPICECRDTSPRGCHPLCKACALSVSDGLFTCKDKIVNFCRGRCTRRAADDM